MAPLAVTVRYPFSEGRGDGGRDACFHGLFFGGSEAVVLRRLREAHRFAERVEIVDIRRHGPRGAACNARQGGGP